VIKGNGMTSGEEEILNNLLNSGKKPNKTGIYALAKSLSEGNESVIELWLQDENVEISDIYNAMILAEKKNRINILKLILKDRRIDLIKKRFCVIEDLICSAAECGNEEIFELLFNLPDVELDAMDYHIIRWSSKNNHIGILKTILADERIDLKNNDFMVIDWVLKNNSSEEVIEILLGSNKISDKAWGWVFRKIVELKMTKIIEILFSKKIDPTGRDNIALSNLFIFWDENAFVVFKKMFNYIISNKLSKEGLFKCFEMNGEFNKEESAQKYIFDLLWYDKEIRRELQLKDSVLYEAMLSQKVCKSVSNF